MQPTYVLICSEPGGGCHEVADALGLNLARRGSWSQNVKGTAVIAGMVESIRSNIKTAPPYDSTCSRLLAGLKPYDTIFDSLGGAICSHGALIERGIWGRLAKQAAVARTTIAAPEYVIISGLPYLEDFSHFPNACKVWVYCPAEKRTFSGLANFPDKHPSRFAFDSYLANDGFDVRLSLYEKTVDEEADALASYLKGKRFAEYKPLPESEGPCLTV